jgi:arylsulfatase A-like enzyme
MLLLASALLASGYNAPAPAVVVKPHIVLMLTDDLGFNAPGYRNPDLVTPTLDQLALKEGVILENFYT